MFHLARADGRHGRMLFHLTKCHKRSCMVYQLATLTTRLVMCNQHFVIKVSCDTTIGPQTVHHSRDQSKLSLFQMQCIPIYL